MAKEKTATVRLLINLSSGTVELEAPPKSVGKVLNQIEEFLPAFADACSIEADSGEDADGTRTPPPAAASTASSNGAETNQNTASSSTTRTRKRRTEAYEPAELSLDDSQRESFRSFVSEKKPKTQRDKSLVAMSWLSDNGADNEFTGSHITSAFQMMSERVPKKISSVFSVLANDGFVKYHGDGKYSITPVGKDRVSYDLPPSSDT